MLGVKLEAYIVPIDCCTESVYSFCKSYLGAALWHANTSGKQ